MSDTNDILRLFRLAASRVSENKDEYISPLSIQHRRGIFGFGANTIMAFETGRYSNYSESVVFCQKSGYFHYAFSNLNSNPAPGREKSIELITPNPDVIAQRLLQYKVA